jgi:phospholipid-binding lipoprotein MlaA
MRVHRSGVALRQSAMRRRKAIRLPFGNQKRGVRKSTCPGPADLTGILDRADCDAVPLDARGRPVRQSSQRRSREAWVWETFNMLGLMPRWGMTSRPPALRPTIWVLLLSTFAIAGGCSTTRYYDVGSRDGPELERMNRAAFSFNEDFDRQVVEPIAQQYVSHVPNDLRKSISSFVYNLNEPIYSVNFLLQGNVDQSAAAAGRFVLNTSLGLFGFVDYAGMIGLAQKRTSFDLTLAYWGIPSGEYIVLPILGPSSPRKILADVGEGILDPLNAIPALNGGATVAARAIATGGLRRVEVSSDLRTLREDSLDIYARVKSLYLQQYSKPVPVERDLGNAR